MSESPGARDDEDVPGQRHKRRRWPLVVLLVVLLVVALLSGLRIYQVNAVNTQASDFYRALSAQGTKTSGGVKAVDWNIMKAENADTAA